MNTTVKIGAIGLSITLALNIFALLVLEQDAARFFTGEWWSVWFPASIVWLVMTIVGLGRGRVSSPS